LQNPEWQSKLVLPTHPRKLIISSSEEERKKKAGGDSMETKI
jgi:hypothetical protein